jgi:predicted CopG family antitoxin
MMVNGTTVVDMQDATISNSIEIAIYAKLSSIENELDSIRTLLRRPKRVVSLRGIAKSLVSDEELETSIKDAKKSLFKGADDVLRG